MITPLLKNIRSTRKRKGISQMDMASNLGIDYSTYGKIERGNISLTVDRMEKIAEILDVPVSEIYPRANTSNIELLEALKYFMMVSTGGDGSFHASPMLLKAAYDLALNAIKNTP